VKKLKLYCILFLCVFGLLIPRHASAQAEDTSAYGWFTYGINMGFYFPDNKPAKFYDGSVQNENSIDYVINNYYYRQQIEQELGYMLDSTNPYTLPGNLRYKPTYNIGFYFKVTRTKTTGFFAQFNYSRLIAKDIILINIDKPNTSFDPAYRQATIRGKENRYIIDIGYTRTYPGKKNTDLYLEYGINLTNVRVMEHLVQIGSTQYNLVNQFGSQGYIPGSTQESYKVVQGGMGLGFFTTGGLKLKFNNAISVDPGCTLYFHHINLGKWDAIRPSFNLFVRLIMPF